MGALLPTPSASQIRTAAMAAFMFKTRPRSIWRKQRTTTSGAVLAATARPRHLLYSCTLLAPHLLLKLHIQAAATGIGARLETTVAGELSPFKWVSGRVVVPDPLRDNESKMFTWVYYKVLGYLVMGRT